MDSEKNFEIDKKFSVLDAFKTFFFVVAITVLISFVYSFIATQIAGFKGISIEEFEASVVGVVLSFLFSSLTLVTIFFVYSKCVKVKIKYALGDGQKISLLPISIAMVTAIICIFLFTPFVQLIEHLCGVMPEDIPLKEEISSSFVYFLLAVLLFAFLPALAEELVFRGIILRGLSSRLNGGVAIVISSLMFTLIHGAIDQTVYQFIVGILLGFLAYVGGSILYLFILHFLNNLMVVIFSSFDIVDYLTNRPIYYNVFSMIFPFLLFLLGVFLVVVLMWVLKYLRNKNFFRYEPKKKKKSKKKKEVVEEKVGFKGFWKSLSSNEKVFMFAGLGLALLIWLLGTLTIFAS